MRLTQIRDFLTVVETGSITAAARALGVSQPGITKSIGGLEAELAVALLQRTPRGVTLTRFGRSFYARARAAHSELDKAQQELLQMKGLRTGKVAVGFGPWAAALILPDAVLRFRQRYPDVELRLLEGFGHALFPLLRNEALDMVMALRLPGHSKDPALRFRPVFHNEQIVVGRRGHPLTRAQSVIELASTTWLSFEPRAAVDQVLNDLGFAAARQVILCESLNVMLGLLSDSDMLAMVSRRLLALPWARNVIEEIPTAKRMPSLTTGVYTSASALLTPAAAYMAKMLMETGRELSARRRDSADVK